MFERTGRQACTGRGEFEGQHAAAHSTTWTVVSPGGSPQIARARRARSPPLRKCMAAAGRAPGGKAVVGGALAGGRTVRGRGCSSSRATRRSDRDLLALGTHRDRAAARAQPSASLVGRRSLEITIREKNPVWEALSLLCRTSLLGAATAGCPLSAEYTVCKIG